jgi:hypothetical protein
MSRLAIGVLGLLLISATVATEQGAIRLGEGLGQLAGYDPLGPTVKIEGVRVGLTPSAAASLKGQLARKGWSIGEAFGAKYVIVPNSAGQPVIGSIHVFPKRFKE